MHDDSLRHERSTPACPDCVEPNFDRVSHDRRAFLRTMGAGAAVLVAGPTVASRLARGADAETRPAKPAEALIRELHATLSDEQKKELVRPWDHKSGNQLTRHGMYNRPIDGQRIGDKYTAPQQELLDRILRAIVSGDDGFARISRNGKWDGSGSFQGLGAHVFGDPTGDAKFAWVLSGHHLTIRCDGNSEPGAAFGGPMYYGHSAHGYSPQNVFNYQTKAVQGVFAGLDAKQQKQAVVTGSPGEHEASIAFRDAPHPGIALSELSADQRKLVQSAMSEILSPYRKEDADEVLQIVQKNGGVEKIHLAFYQDGKATDGERWHFWRLEGPGFVWNFRVLPHVHCYVNVAAQA